MEKYSMDFVSGTLTITAKFAKAMAKPDSKECDLSRTTVYKYIGLLEG